MQFSMNCLTKISHDMLQQSNFRSETDLEIYRLS